jgi:hypothetical protein
MKPVEVREQMANALTLDLIGPVSGLAASAHLEREILPGPSSPSRWYLTGFLAPFESNLEDKSDEDSDDQMDLIPKVTGIDDEAAPEASSTRKTPYPSSIGLSVLVPNDCSKITATVTWGDYNPVEDKESVTGWQRSPKWSKVEIPLKGAKPKYKLPDSDGLEIVPSIRPIPPQHFLTGGLQMVPPGTLAVSVFVLNNREPQPVKIKDTAYTFQVKLHLESNRPFVPRPNLRGLMTDDGDERIADLQFRDAMEFAVGHGTSSHAQVSSDAICQAVESVWIPRSDVERVEPAKRDGVAINMDALAALKDGEQARKELSGLVDQYREWLGKQDIPAEPKRKEVAEWLIGRGRTLAGRIEAGIASLEDAQVLEAFRRANLVMAASARKRNPNQPNPSWYPFQLAFLLLNIKGMADPTHADRELVDLLFFPTGGGKTEAYLGLSAFTIFLRRLRNPGMAGAGVTVIMRYTLRLLTLDQLGRAAALICAMELERQKDVEKLGTWPFEIGLWVGQAATPNEMGKKGDKSDRTARARTRAFKRDDRQHGSPIPLESCPWCGTKFTRNSFTLDPNEDYPIDLRIVCANRRCEFSGDNRLPIVGVDEPIYRRLPAFLIATVDKFANLPWVGPSGKLFGKVDRCDKDGFYGPCDPQSAGHKMPQPLLPPDLIIQDELHLISGPLGTMVGLYETAIDALCRRQVGEKAVRPKVVASTATVRRAETQIRALFCRGGVEIFPCPGPNRRDSFFARTVSAKDKPGRLYLGVAAQGRSPKVIMLRTYLALMGAAQKAFLAYGGIKNAANPADPYMTLVGYFNSLRELGGCRRIVEDEVYSQLRGRGSRLRIGEQTGLFADREIQVEAVELTSRESTAQVSRAKERLAKDFTQKDDRVDVAIATNMISVGLDISRLGLMAVFGQPKTTAEYIQATSRVGRQEDKPGLVITMMNVHKPRDRSHYERFEAYHATFYRSVEASSVTPFSPRALDRGIAEVTVALARHGHPALTRSESALKAKDERSRLADVVDVFGQRAESHAVMSKEESDERRGRVRAKVEDLLDDWAKIARAKHDKGGSLRYQAYEDGTGPYLLRNPLDPDLERVEKIERQFKAHRSLRDVEPSTNLWMKQLNGIEIEGEEVD